MSQTTKPLLFFKQLRETLVDFNNILACSIKKKLDANIRFCPQSTYLILILLLHYLVKWERRNSSLHTPCLKKTVQNYFCQNFICQL